MRKKYTESITKEKNIRYKGKSNARLNNLIDAVFGIALTLLIFSISDAHSFSDLLIFAKSFPALILSILFLYLIWKEHVSFSMIYTFKDNVLQLLNILFIGLVLFYVYPLRFLTKLLTNIFFDTGIDIRIEQMQIPDLMIFYGLVTFSVYFILYLFYATVVLKRKKFDLNKYELFFTKSHSTRLLIMALVPFISLVITYFIKDHSILWASILGGSSYGLYPILIQLWSKRFKTKKLAFLKISYKKDQSTDD